MTSANQSNLSTRVTVVDICLWMIYVGIMLPILGSFGYLGFVGVQMEVIPRSNPPPSADKTFVILMVSVALLGFAIHRGVNLAIEFYKKIREWGLPNQASQKTPQCR